MRPFPPSTVSVVSGRATTARQQAPTPPDRTDESQNANKERSMIAKQLDVEHRSQPFAANDSRNRLPAL